MSRLAPPRTRLLLAADRRAEEQARALGTELRRLREDSGLALRAVARAARIAPAHLVDIELSRCDASRKALARVAAVLGADISERIFPNTGPLIRDRLQTPILDALLAIVDPRWARHLEVPITGRVRGVIDLVLVDAVPALLVAGEIESGIRRLEQQIRWAHEKADAIGEQAAKLGIRGPARVSRLMVVRSTAHTREIARATRRPCVRNSLPGQWTRLRR